ncbi:MAG TPA: patatin family protein [Caldilineae bacterium]|nr:patatin family protein [Caldilineae bacterium]HIQ12578.1 patatin family protein [Caldilineales bacterium]
MSIITGYQPEFIERLQRVESSKTAIVLAGGGLTGAVYEVGALRAIDAMLVDRSVNDFDIIVGTSAGALVGSMLARGITPAEMMRVLDGTSTSASRILPRHLFSLNTQEFLQKSLRFPITLKNAISHYLRHRNDMNVADILWSLTEALPSGLYDNRTLEQFMRGVWEEYGLSDDFRDVQRELYVIATDLDTGKRVVFGAPSWRHVPISKAIAASSAVPLLYRPVRIDDQEFVDGAVRGNASLDIAIEAGARLIVCINPLVPIDNSQKRAIPLLGEDGRFISEKGAQAVLSQFMRISLRSGLAYHIKQLRRRYPDIDIILIEPRRDDFAMAFYNIMRYSARVTIAQHGYQSVTLDLEHQYRELKAILARHGIPITRRLVAEELEAMREANYDLEVVRKTLEKGERRLRFRRKQRLPQLSPVQPTENLRDALAQLEYSLAILEERKRMEA